MEKVPVVVSKIPGLIGTLGPDYPGYYRCGDTAGLRGLLLRAERDAAFFRGLQRSCRQAARLVAPGRERAAWRKLLNELSHHSSRKVS